MRRATSLLRQGEWDQAAAEGSFRLDHEQRHRRRIVLVTDQGESVLLDLAEPARMRGGDALLLHDGAVLAVIAAPEEVVDIEAGSPMALARIAYHIGNRHLPLQLLENRLRMRPDPVVEDMVERLGGILVRTRAPFDPEGGAYGHGSLHAHPHP